MATGAGRLSGTRSPATWAMENSTITLAGAPTPTGSCLPSPTPGRLLHGIHVNWADDSDHHLSQRRQNSKVLGCAEFTALLMLMGWGSIQHTSSLSMQICRVPIQNVKLKNPDGAYYDLARGTIRAAQNMQCSSMPWASPLGNKS